MEVKRRLSAGKVLGFFNHRTIGTNGKKQNPWAHILLFEWEYNRAYLF